ncbi:MAG: prepilin-type N-terminal cleavage/methylation domain-containing protein [Kiritimatiellia bacterium]
MAADRRAGLSLVEVMLALLILGIGISSLVMATSRCLAVVRKAKNFEIARRLMGEIELTDPLIPGEIEAGEESGNFDSPYSDWRWTRSVEEDENDEESGLFKITMRVYWSEKGRETYEEVLTYLYSPEDKGGGTVESR